MDTTVLRSPAELRAFLKEAGTLGPSLHPQVRSGDRYEWNGWNLTITVGVEAEGRPFLAYLSHYASGHDIMTAGPVVGIPHGSLNDDDLPRWKSAGILFPVEVAVRYAQILHPEHTPEPAAS